MAYHLMTIQELNRYPFVEIGHCWRCGENFKLTQLRLPEPPRVTYPEMLVDVPASMSDAGP